MTDVADTLHGQNDEIEPTNHKESTTADQPEKEQKTSDQLEEMEQLKGEVIAAMEEFQKQQQHNIDKPAVGLLNVDYLQSDQKELLGSRQQRSALIDQGTSQLKGELSAKMVEECQNQQKQNIDALTEAQKGNEFGCNFNSGGAMAAIRSFSNRGGNCSVYFHHLYGPSIECAKW
uniref:Ground-like domain-containing protein n=1 Tax=Globodera pallida TaxID=36090 RepID=A0A183C951_GLOPA